MAHLSVGKRLWLPCYTITGATAAPVSGESSLATYATFAAFKAAVIPAAVGEACQLLGYPIASDTTRMVADRNSSGLFWRVAS